jgi:hypothetical protein
MFIGSLIATFAIFIVNLSVYLINKASKEVNNTVVIIILSVIGGLLGIPIVIFSLFHFYLCVTGRTTREVIKNIDNDTATETQWCLVDSVNINFF